MLSAEMQIDELHINSTISELHLVDAHIDIDMRLCDARSFLDNSPNIPGLIITSDGAFSSLISRKALFEILSKPYGLELFSKRPIRFFLEASAHQPSLILHSTTSVIDAAQKAFEREDDTLDTPIVVEFDNGRLKLLDSSHLLLAHLHINSLALKSLKEANEMKTELLSIAAHDLKNPLGSVLGLSKVLKEMIEVGLDEKQEMNDMCGMIYESADHMLKLINELLNTTIIEAGQMKLNKRCIDALEIVNILVYQNRTQADAKYQTIEFTIDKASDYYIYGDSIKIREAFDNIISNAIKYSPHSALIQVKLSIVGDMIKFSAKDQGPGISEEDKLKLFGKYQRLSAQPTGGEFSTGLGLYICKQIIELHEGNIFVESEIGNGSTFIIELPKVDYRDFE